jgi:Flp pilus assembly protein TadD
MSDIPLHVTDSTLAASGSVPGTQRSLERARLAAEMHKWPTALVLVRSALECIPDDPAALSLYGLALARTGGDRTAAVEACRRAVESQPYVAQWHSHLGAVYAAAGLAPQAMVCFRAALALDPHDALASQGLTECGRARRWRDWFARRTRRRASPLQA